jgi:hypothetical protein
MTTTADKTKVAIICTKTYEFDQFCAYISKCLGPMCTSPKLIKDGVHSYREYILGTWTLVAITFGEVQGPVQVATRVSHVIMFHRPSHIGMVGTCAGRKLGEVIIAKGAISVESGHYLKLGNHYQLQNKKDGEFVDKCCVPIMQFEKMAGTIKSLESKFPFPVCCGMMYSYHQIREDCALILPDEIGGLDMEAFAFFKAVEYLSDDDGSPVALPVIKSVSNVGDENLDIKSRHYEYNMNILKKAEISIETDNRTIRRAFRKLALDNSIIVMVHLLIDLFVNKQ